MCTSNATNDYETIKVGEKVNYEIDSHCSEGCFAQSTSGLQEMVGEEILCGSDHFPFIFQHLSPSFPSQQTRKTVLQVRAKPTCLWKVCFIQISAYSSGEARSRKSKIYRLFHPHLPFLRPSVRMRNWWSLVHLLHSGSIAFVSHRSPHLRLRVHVQSLTVKLA